MTRPIAVLVMLALVAACDARGEAGGAGAPVDSVGGSGSGGAVLIPSLEVRVVGDTVHLQLQVSNAADTAVVLTFASTQRYDFGVETETGESVWRWSADRMFGQVLGEERLMPGASLSYREAWPAGGRSGRFVAVGQVVSTSHAVELRTEFEAGS